jgi:hypothetical protein
MVYWIHAAADLLLLAGVVIMARSLSPYTRAADEGPLDSQTRGRLRTGQVFLLAGVIGALIADFLAWGK